MHATKWNVAENTERLRGSRQGERVRLRTQQAKIKCNEVLGGERRGEES